MSKKTKADTSEQISRVIVGFSIFFIAMLTIYFGGLLLSFALLVVFYFANTEFINIVRAKGINPSNKWIRFVSMMFFVIASLPLFGLPVTLPLKLYVFTFIFGVVGCFFRLIFRGNKNEPIATIPDIGASVLGFVYTGLLPSFLILLRQQGLVYVLIAILGIAFCDVGAYYGGKLFGKTALKPEISAKKTLEGALSGFCVSMIASILLVILYKEFFGNNIIHGIFIGLFCGIFSQFGDLFESLLKRDAGLKDSGKVLLSHGGILDRIDGYFFVVWAIYFYISWFVLGEFKL